jgi:hypothetical protein
MVVEKYSSFVFITHIYHRRISIAVFIFFFLAYSPVLASPEFQVTYRYGLVTMPIILYLIFWSINAIVNSYSSDNAYIFLKFIRAIVFMLATLAAICYSNMMVADGIVGPHHQDFTYIQNQLQQKVLPLLKNNQKVVIHAIDCQYQQQIIGVVIHSLMKMGHASNYSKHNVVIYHDNEIIVKDTPWGTLVVNGANNDNNDLTQYTGNDKTIVTIDTREMPPYQSFSFYKELLGISPT